MKHKTVVNGLIILLPVLLLSCGEINLNVKKNYSDLELNYTKIQITKRSGNLIDEINFCLNNTANPILLRYYIPKENKNYVCVNIKSINHLISNYLFLRKCIINLKQQLDLFNKLNSYKIKRKLK